MHDLSVGLKGEARTTVTESNTAIAYGSGGVPVFATPAMVALMEGAAINAVNQHLHSGYTTVGVKVEAEHLAATPVGMAVVAEAELVEIDGHRLVFEVTVRDEREVVGRGRHDRFIVQEEKFLARVKQKVDG